MPLDFPLNPLEKGSIEDTKFEKIQARTFIGGIPVFTTARDVSISTPQQGEIWAEFLSGSLQICVYYNSIKYSIK